ncbi:hypothetical protein LTR91_012284 [Friedmanniomyces endolithicus]|uniref:Caleosin domain-containing protein n=1 Tax=Friedmanniomyces endolithicus TaxID=329885 RepID=A0AAN6KFQ3_9PEZI|nr:hypothetical protein LTR94_011409 [Friedmanniomyces endolithicus]KAK0780000.1 hypothetical protein LTR59_012980 [Friedmanniomyces endolithicus]KAK0792208.1 hypothetical protein LTR38_009965 [Friedmanniomyces endolithicus]KAK0806184.1 hypothetical protein LTR75_007023 [Friedmanniomyces endolithicus]KAK0857295.1 hypothetical protein LTR03_000785 [Friedmanniomyces endolithicus]
MGIFGFVQALLVAVPDRSDGDINANPKVKQLVKQHGRDISHYPPDKPYSVCVSTCPITVQRLPYIPTPNSPLLDPGTPRATTAPSTDSPHGTLQANWAARHTHQTVLQQHCAYWDPDSDGIIWPLDTWRGVRAWGWNIFLSALATCIIHAGLSYPSVPGSWLPDPFMRIWVRQVHKCKHGSDSGSYETEGRFSPHNFEGLFAKFDEGGMGGLDLGDVARALKGQRCAFDLFGWSAAALEWLAVYLLLWPEDGVMRKEDIRRVFDGSIFQQKADEYAEKCAKQGRTRKALVYGKRGY